MKLYVHHQCAQTALNLDNALLNTSLEPETAETSSPDHQSRRQPRQDPADMPRRICSGPWPEDGTVRVVRKDATDHCPRW
jgi:hypothetical protein